MALCPNCGGTGMDPDPVRGRLLRERCRDCYGSGYIDDPVEDDDDDDYYDDDDDDFGIAGA